MPLPFSAVCDLLEESYRLCQSRKSNTAAVHAWFRRHRTTVDAHDADRAALLSTLLPEKRTDRVYCIQAPTLERIIGRALMLGTSRMLELAAYKRPGAGADLADCVERILSVTPNPVRAEVTVEEVDALLHGLAARVRWSAPAIRQPDAGMSHRSRGDLEAMYRRLPAREAKWFTRLLLKDYQPLLFDAPLLYRSCDPALPCVLQIRDDFSEALGALSSARGSLLPMAATVRGPMSARRVLATVKPKLGVKVGRQQWHKGRSIKHCIDMGGTRMSVETKMDGEYCQIHVDMGKATKRVQIFSKSSKDSTEDRFKVIPAIERALRLNRNERGFQKACILEGELVVYNDLENTIMPFHKIRGHVTRRGRYLNTEQDSQPKPYEHLMIVYYDILLLDDQSLMDIRHSERLKLLEKVIYCERGVAALVQRETIDFRHSLAASALRKAFAKVVVERGEGLVLKPDEPYIVVDENGRAAPCRCIKLKKEYIGAFGDIGDFALVGAGFHAAKAKTYRIPNLKWTHFYVGCLNNKEEVQRWNQKPEFTVVCAVELSEPLLESFLALGELAAAVPRAENTCTTLVVPPGIQCPADLTVAFTNPIVADLRCFSFDRPGNTGFWTPRFPAVTKIHADRDYATDVLSFDELQSLAEEAVMRPELEDSQENLHWIAKLEGADPRGVAVDAMSSQATRSTMPTPSPVKMTQSTATGTESQSSSRAATETSRHSQHMQASTPVVLIALSSVADETSPQKTSMNAPAKRTPERASPDKTFKRPRMASSRRKQAVPAAPPPRTPLQDMNVNISCSDASSQSINSQDSQATVKLIDLPGSKVANREVIEIPSSDAEDDGWTQQTGDRVSIPASLHGRKSQGPLRCKHVGGKCELVGKTMILASPALLHVAELMSLFREHGVEVPRVIPCVETWWRNHGSGGAHKQQQSWLLVDSVQQAAETRALGARLKAARRRERDLIKVYDWRVLRHLSIAEDARIVKKYYDGFPGPMGRWFCAHV
ncbi:ATP dependent DNA ligase domain protein [Cordyceps fumosorosea ARSEF 2679]|uniref:ATP dependent DNA ligase domain protein n=1 Tax=Cordyceps fumosorosea (strain ARSEF 2679) TaxID=1081104 RepID=A0A168D7T4_CORFA|nr:ATP dependent DNA ligase domain protein [Cordyceps fumosorosea ARSEF 2679]OAA72266.1 ATP dependent DNA ligase domain protein [Cordyceps fumosorosea ARSEF 2679]